MHGLERVFAAGDITSFPVKQGGIATQQADVAAEAIAADARAPTSSPPPSIRSCAGCCGPGAEPRYLYGRLAGGHGEVSCA